MARLFFAGPRTFCDGGQSVAVTFISALLARNNYNDDGPGFLARSLTTNFIGSFNFGLTDATAAARKSFYLRWKMRVRRLPTAEKSFFFTTSSGEAGPGLVMSIDTVGHLLAYNQGNSVPPGSLIATSSNVVNVGLGASGWNVFEMYVEYSTGANNLGKLYLVLNGVTVYDNRVSGVLPNSATGLNLNQNCSSLSFQARSGDATNTGLDLDCSNISCDDSAMPGETQVTLIPLNGQGFYNNWAGANVDWRHHQQFMNFNNPLNMISTNVINSRHSFTVPTMRSQGITGNIKGIRILSAVGQAPANIAGTMFIRKGGVDTDIPVTFTWSNTLSFYHSANIPVTGFTVDDALEIGIVSGASAGTYQCFQMYLLVEHDTPFVPPVLGDFQIAKGNYTGTGALQSITLPFTPEFILIWPRGNTNNGVWWHKGLWAFKDFNAAPGTALNYIWTRDDQLHLLNNNAGVNGNTIVYDYLVISDPQNRIWASTTWSQVSQTSPYDTDDTQVQYPITPTAVFSSAETENTNLGANNTFFFGPGQADDTARTMATGAVVSNRIRRLNTDGFLVRKGSMVGGIQYYSWGLKPTGFQQTQLTDIVTWVGDGASSRIIPVAVSGKTPCMAIAIPGDGTTAKYIRFDTFSNSREWQTTSTSATAITAFGVNSVTIGSTLNTLGTSYSMIVYAEGVDSPQLNQYSGIYFLDPTARHDTLWNRAAGGPIATTNVKIPKPIYRTYFVGDK